MIHFPNALSIASTGLGCSQELGTQSRCPKCSPINQTSISLPSMHTGNCVSKYMLMMQMRDHARGRGLSSGTCAHDSSEDPALAIFNRFEPALEPLLQDGHAAAPVQWAGATTVFALPLALHHAPVVVAVHLDIGGTGPATCSVPTLLSHSHF